MNAFRQILARVTKVNCDTSIDLPPNSRKFQDYAAYITHASSLWVWSKSGLETQKAIKDVNRGNFVYEHQVQVELLEYGFILNKSLAEKSQSLKAFSDILLLRKELASLKPCKIRLQRIWPSLKVRLNIMSQGVLARLESGLRSSAWPLQLNLHYQ